MAPAFSIDITPINDIQWLSTDSSATQTTQTLTRPVSGYSGCYYHNSPYLSKKKEETRKERLIRWASAFKCFYPKLLFLVIKTQKNELAAYRETCKRRMKFKGQNRNLIL